MAARLQRRIVELLLRRSRARRPDARAAHGRAERPARGRERARRLGERARRSRQRHRRARACLRIRLREAVATRDRTRDKEHVMATWKAEVFENEYLSADATD